MAKIIYDTQISDLLDFLAAEGAVYVPAEKDVFSFSGQFAFKQYERGDKLVLDYPVTVLSPKEFLLPAKEVLFSFSDEKTDGSRPEKQTLFGLSIEDLEGLCRLGDIFSEPVHEEAFMKRFETTILVAVDKYSPPKDVSYDLYLQEIEKGIYVATAGSKTGKRILTKNHFREHKKAVPRTRPVKDTLLEDPLLKRAVEKSKSHPIWSELTETCFGCGICSYVCPLCFCFEVEDELEFGNKKEGSRCRNWDSCLLRSFADTTQKNFRPELKDRIYNWYFHKFVRMPKEYGFSGCVDCNRCVIYCPAKINYRKVLAEVLADYKKRGGK